MRLIQLCYSRPNLSSAGRGGLAPHSIRFAYCNRASWIFTRRQGRWRLMKPRLACETSAAMAEGSIRHENHQPGAFVPVPLSARRSSCANWWEIFASECLTNKNSKSLMRGCTRPHHHYAQSKWLFQHLKTVRCCAKKWLNYESHLSRNAQKRRQRLPRHIKMP